MNEKLKSIFKNVATHGAAFGAGFVFDRLLNRIRLLKQPCMAGQRGETMVDLDELIRTLNAFKSELTEAAKKDVAEAARLAKDELAGEIDAAIRSERETAIKSTVELLKQALQTFEPIYIARAIAWAVLNEACTEIEPFIGGKVRSVFRSLLDKDLEKAIYESNLKELRAIESVRSSGSHVEPLWEFIARMGAQTVTRAVKSPKTTIPLALPPAVASHITKLTPQIVSKDAKVLELAKVLAKWKDERKPESYIFTLEVIIKSLKVGAAAE